MLNRILSSVRSFAAGRRVSTTAGMCVLEGLESRKLLSVALQAATIDPSPSPDPGTGDITEPLHREGRKDRRVDRAEGVKDNASTDPNPTDPVSTDPASPDTVLAPSATTTVLSVATSSLLN